MSNSEKDTRYCVKCNVKNCVYHSGDDNCDAGNIEVGPSQACDCNETECQTFMAK